MFNNNKIETLNPYINDKNTSPEDIALKADMLYWRADTIRAFTVKGLSKSSKARISIYPQLNIINSKDLIIVGRGNKREVTGFRSFFDGSFVANVRPGSTSSLYSSVEQELYRQLQIATSQYAAKVIKDLRDQLKQAIALDNKQAAEGTLKDDELHKHEKEFVDIYGSASRLDTLVRELDEYIYNTDDGLVDKIRKALNKMPTKPAPIINKNLVFTDTKLTEDNKDLPYFTKRLPYQNPLNKTLDDKKEQKWNKVFDVFFDNFDSQVVRWYMGATLSNVPIYDSRISKMLLVTSRGGGAGKNTFFNALSTALFTDEYRDVKPDFDALFASSNRFSAADVTGVRYMQANEANFNASFDTENKDEHDFSGLRINEIKSYISDGNMSRERKFGDILRDRVGSMFVVLTNYLPDVQKEARSLNRRLIAVVMKASTMEEKGRALSKILHTKVQTEQDLNEYFVNHAEELAIYCAEYFSMHQRKFTNLLYSTDDSKDEVIDSEKTENESKKQLADDFEEESSKDPVKALCHLVRQQDLDDEKLHEALIDTVNRSDKSQNDKNNEDMCYVDGLLYINQRKKTLNKYECLELRQALLDLNVPRVRKFRQKMFVFGPKDKIDRLNLLDE